MVAAVYWLAACTPVFTPTPNSGPTATSRSLPTAVVEPTAQVVPTAKLSDTVPPQGTAAQLPAPRSTPIEIASLNESGPWLVGLGDAGLVAVNPDGTGRTALQGPSLWQPKSDIAEGDGLSPMGWIAARTGLPNDWSQSLFTSLPRLDAPEEVGIAIWRLPGLRPVRVIPRFSDSLLAGMNEVRHFDLPYGEEATGPVWQLDMAFLSLLHEDARLFWSPNGRYLAFAAALDGLSADVYAYDAQEDSIRRLTDGPNQAILLGWSPDSRWILHYEASEYVGSHGEMIGFAAEVLWAVTVDGSRIVQLGSGERTLPTASGWLSPRTVVLTAGTGGSSLPSRLWRIDLESGARLERRDLSIYSVAVDPATDVIAVNAESLIDPDGGYRDGGLYVFRMADAEPRRAGFEEQLYCYGCQVGWSGELGLFSLFSPSWAERPEAPITFLPSGEIVTEYKDEQAMPVVSPDGNWVAFARNGVHIYGPQGSRIDVPGKRVHELVWGADSTSLFYLEELSGGTALMLLNVPEDIPTRLRPEVGITGLHVVE